LAGAAGVAADRPGCPTGIKSSASRGCCSAGDQARGGIEPVDRVLVALLAVIKRVLRILATMLSRALAREAARILGGV
jgi:hypothetical protein